MRYEHTCLQPGCHLKQLNVAPGLQRALVAYTLLRMNTSTPGQQRTELLGLYDAQDQYNNTDKLWIRDIRRQLQPCSIVAR